MATSMYGCTCIHTHLRNASKIKRKGNNLVKFCHGMNVTGRENLITCRQTNELADTLLTEYTLSVVKAYKMGLYCTTYKLW